MFKGDVAMKLVIHSALRERSDRSAQREELKACFIFQSTPFRRDVKFDICFFGVTRPTTSATESKSEKEGSETKPPQASLCLRLFSIKRATVYERKLTELSHHLTISKQVMVEERQAPSTHSSAFLHTQNTWADQRDLIITYRTNRAHFFFLSSFLFALLPSILSFSLHRQHGVVCVVIEQSQPSAFLNRRIRLKDVILHSNHFLKSKSSLAKSLMKCCKALCALG